MTTQTKINEIREAVLGTDNVLVIGDAESEANSMVDEALSGIDGKVKRFFSAGIEDTDLAGLPAIDGGRTVPVSMMAAEVLVFQDLNRATPHSLDLVFEIADKGTIKGEKLPNLRCVVATMDDDSVIAKLDAREHFQVEIKA